MIARQEINDPNSCINKAKQNEMTFVLLARDASAPHAIRAWVQHRIDTGKNQADDAKIQEALACAKEMERQRKEGID